MSEIPAEMKKDNWALYVLARSHDPAVNIPYTRQLVSSLIATMAIAGEHQFDELLSGCKEMASTAFRIYDEEKNWARAMVMSIDVLDLLGPLLYDPKYAISKSDSFKFPIKETSQEGGGR